MWRTASLVSTTSAAAWSVIGSFDLTARGEGSGLISMTCWLSSGLCMVLPLHMGIAFVVFPEVGDRCSKAQNIAYIKGNIYRRRHSWLKILEYWPQLHRSID